MSSRRGTLPSLVLAFCLCSHTALSLAQEATPSPAPAPSPTSIQPTAVPAAEISSAAERASGELRKLREQLQPDNVVNDISRQVQEVQQSAEARLSEIQTHLGTDMQLRELLSLQDELDTLSTRINGWQRALVARVGALEGLLARIGDLEVVWRSTREAARKEDLPAAVLGTVTSTLKDIANTEQEAHGRRAAALSLQGTVSTMQARVNELLARVNQAHASLRDSLFAYESAPLWTAVAGEAPPGGTLDGLMTLWLKELDAAFAYLRTRLFSLTIQLLAMAALAVFVYRLGRGSAEWAKADPDLEASVRLVERPISAALVVGIVAGRWIYPDRPMALNGLAGLLLLVAVLRLLPASRVTGGTFGLYGLFLVALVGRVMNFIPSWSLAQRLLLLVECLLLMAWLVWIGGTSRVKVITFRPAWRVALRLGSRAGVALLVAAALANLVGNVTLADFIATVVFGSVAAAVLLSVVTSLVGGLFELVLRWRPVRALRSVRLYRSRLRGAVDWFLHVAAVALWIITATSLLGVYDEITASAENFLGKSFEIGNLSLSAGSILILILAFWLTLRLSRVAGVVLEEDVLPRLHLPRGIPYAVALVARYAIVAIGFLLATSAAGVELGKIAIVLGALGVGIGLGLQNVVSNFVSGLILLFERPIQVGDTVERGPLMGEVKRIGIRSSTVRTVDGAEVIVPNEKLIADEVINWTLSDSQRRVELPIGVAYGSDPRQVLELLLRIAKEHPETLDQPEPTVFFVGFGESSLDFSLRCWVDRFDDGYRVRSEIGVAVHDALREAGIEIPFPQRELRLRPDGTKQGQ